VKFFLPIVFLVSLNLFSQQSDIIVADTTKITLDSSLTVLRDSLLVDSTKYIHADTLCPIFQRPFYEESFFVDRKTINKLNYRYTGDLFSPVGFSILKDKGAIGQCNEPLLYGSGTGSVGYFFDGILYNNRFTNTLDLNFIPSELIDSIEIVPLPRGFLYGADNYIAAVNFIDKDFLTPVPYTRIKYYEGPSGEAFVDGIFNTSLFYRLNFTFDVTNRKFDSTYTNSDFSLWQAEFKLKYFLSNSVNLIGSYSLVSSEHGLNGGVDVDSISRFTSDVNTVLYDPLEAPVVDPTLRQEVKWDKFGFRVLGNFGKYYSDLNFYYHNVNESYSSLPSKDEIKNYVLGASLGQSYSYSAFNIKLNGIFEKRELNYYFIDAVSGFQRAKTEYNVFSVSPVFSLYLLDSTLIPTIFFKLTDYTNVNTSIKGFGGDLRLKVLDILGLYFGISKFDFFYGYETDLYEIGARLKYKRFFTNVKLYGRNSAQESIIIPLTSVSSLTYSGPSSDFTGFALSVHYDFWKFGLEESFNYNSFEGNQHNSSSEIKIYLNGGIFYKDILFNQDLDLKTGFVVNYYDFVSDNFESAFQVDFTLVGIIQKVAIVYFSWENLFDEKYFLVPYYPMRERGIRFGLAWELLN
jgi:hypothetical protein